MVEEERGNYKKERMKKREKKKRKKKKNIKKRKNKKRMRKREKDKRDREKEKHLGVSFVWCSSGVLENVPHRYAISVQTPNRSKAI